MDTKTQIKYSPICSPKEIATMWDTTANNIRKVYVTNEQKKVQHQMLDMGAYCVIHNLDGQMLKFFVEHRDEFVRVFHSITAEEMLEFKEFKKFKLFQEAQK